MFTPVHTCSHLFSPPRELIPLPQEMRGGSMCVVEIEGGISGVGAEAVQLAGPVGGMFLWQQDDRNK